MGFVLYPFHQLCFSSLHRLQQFSLLHVLRGPVRGLNSAFKQIKLKFLQLVLKLRKEKKKSKINHQNFSPSNANKSWREFISKCHRWQAPCCKVYKSMNSSIGSLMKVYYAYTQKSNVQLSSRMLNFLNYKTMDINLMLPVDTDTLFWLLKETLSHQCSAPPQPSLPCRTRCATIHNHCHCKDTRLCTAFHGTTCCSADTASAQAEIMRRKGERRLPLKTHKQTQQAS